MRAGRQVQHLSSQRRWITEFTTVIWLASLCDTQAWRECWRFHTLQEELRFQITFSEQLSLLSSLSCFCPSLAAFSFCLFLNAHSSVPVWGPCHATLLSSGSWIEKARWLSWSPWRHRFCCCWVCVTRATTSGHHLSQPEPQHRWWKTSRKLVMHTPQRKTS